MFGGNEPQGFTIVEVMIFLGVTGIIFLSVVGLVGNQQNKTEFFQGMHQFYSQIQSITNNIQTGSYPYNGKVSCSDAGGTLSFGGPVNGQGAHYGCTYIGFALHFVPYTGAAPVDPDDFELYNVYPVAGLLFSSSVSSQLSSNFADAKPQVVNQDVQTYHIPPGLKVSDVKYVDSTGSHWNSLIGLFTNFPTVNAAGNTQGSSLSTSLIPIPSGNLSKGAEWMQAGLGNTAYNNVAGLGNSSNIDNTNSTVFGASNYTSTRDPSGGVQICLQSLSEAQTYGIVTIGGSGSNGALGNPLSLSMTTYTGSACP